MTGAFQPGPTGEAERTRAEAAFRKAVPRFCNCLDCQAVFAPHVQRLSGGQAPPTAP